MVSAWWESFSRRGRAYEREEGSDASWSPCVRSVTASNVLGSARSKMGSKKMEGTEWRGVRSLGVEGASDWGEVACRKRSHSGAIAWR